VIEFAGGSQNFLDIGNSTYSYKSSVGGLSNQSGATVFMVFNTTVSPAGNQVMLESSLTSNTPSFPRAQVAGSKFYTGTSSGAAGGAYANGNSTVAQNTTYLYSSTFDGTQTGIARLSLAINGTPETLSGLTGAPAATTGSITRMTVGIYDSGNFPLTGNIAEIVIFNRVLTATEYNQVGYALAQTYGLNTAFVPEPGTFAMLLFGGVMLWCFRRNRN
jgi:hypothetical protein